MISSFIQTFIGLDEKDKKKILSQLYSIIFPIKLYLIIVIILLFIMCVSNYYIYHSLKVTL